MYIRFVIAHKDPDSGHRQGVFQALAEASDAGLLYDYEEAQRQELLDWFSENMKVPYSLRRSSKFHTLNKAISWFKDTAIEHVAKMRELAAILEAHDIEVEMIQTDKPGYITYEDRHQIVAEAFSDTGA